MIKVNVKKLNNTSIIPTHGSEYSAGYDLYANIDEPITIRPHETVKVGTGLSFELPIGCFGAIVARSGLATKHGIAPANKFAVCDSDYRGEYIVALHNHSETEYTIMPNDRVAQLVVMPFLTLNFIEVDDLSDTARGDGGFGSTGIN